MSCKDLKAPEPPTLENLPPGIKLPPGQSVDSLKNQASGGGLSSSMNGAQDMIGSGLKKLGASLSPTALASKVGEAIDGVANTITDTVKGAIDGVTSLKNKISSFDPSGFKVPGVGDVKGQVTSKIGGVGEFNNIQSSISSDKCGQKYAGEAAAANKGLKDSANNYMSKLSPKERAEAMKDPAKMAEIQAGAENQVKEDAKASAMNTATSLDKSERSAQDNLQSNKLDTVDNTTETIHKELLLILKDAKLNDIYKSFWWYMLQVYARNDQFEKFGIFGIKNSDASNALDAVRAVGEECLVKQFVQALREWIQLSLDETDIYEQYPEFKDITKVNLKTITDKNTGTTLRTTLNDVHDMYFDYEMRLFEMHNMETLDDIIPMRRDDLVGDVINKFWSDDDTTLNFHHLTPHTGTFGILRYRQLDEQKERDIPTSFNLTTNPCMWFTERPAMENFREVLSKKKDWIADTIQKEKESAYEYVYDQRSALPLTLQSVPESIKKTYNDPTRYIFFARPKLIDHFASQLIQIQWDIDTGAVKSVHALGPGVLDSKLGRSWSKYVKVWKTNSFFENTLN